jgi:hypothetical protein
MMQIDWKASLINMKKFKIRAQDQFVAIADRSAVWPKPTRKNTGVQALARMAHFGQAAQP